MTDIVDMPVIGYNPEATLGHIPTSEEAFGFLKTLGIRTGQVVLMGGGFFLAFIANMFYSKNDFIQNMFVIGGLGAMAVGGIWLASDIFKVKWQSPITSYGSYLN